MSVWARYLSAQALNLAVDAVDVVGLRHAGQARHTQYLARDDHHHARAGIEDDVAHGQVEAADGAVALGVGREGELRLGDADGEMRLSNMKIISCVKFE